MKVGTLKFFKGTGMKKGWYELKYQILSEYRCHISNGRGGCRTEWVKMDPQPDPPNINCLCNK